MKSNRLAVFVTSLHFIDKVKVMSRSQATVALFEFGGKRLLRRKTLTQFWRKALCTLSILVTNKAIQRKAKAPRV